MTRTDTLPSSIDILRQFVAVDTRNPPGNELNLVSRVVEILESASVEYRIHDLGDNRGNLTAVVKATNPIRDPLILNGHLDTVNISGPWNTDPFLLSKVKENLFGLGAADMKGALACQLAVLLSFHTDPTLLKQDLWLVWTAGEEVDCIGAKSIAPDLSHSEWTGMVIGEPSLNQVVTAQKGALWLDLQVPGRSAHGAYPERGINAIQYVSDIVGFLIKAFDSAPVHPKLGGVTVNWSSIQAGAQPNVVPDEAETLLDIRFPPAFSKSEILNDLNDAITKAQALEPKRQTIANVEVTVLNHRESFETNTDDPFVIEAFEVTGQQSAKGMRAYTDGSVFAHTLSCPIVIVGPGDISQAHAPNERVSQGQLSTAIDIYTQLAGR